MASSASATYSDHYDPLWKVCADCGVVVNHHSGGGTPDDGDVPSAGLIWLAETAFFSRRALTHLIASGAFERFPGLRFVLTEQGGSWVTPALAMLDAFHFRISSTSSGGEPGVPEGGRLPLCSSGCFARNCSVAVSFPNPKDGIARHAIGLDHYMWGNDEPWFPMRRSLAEARQLPLGGDAMAAFPGGTARRLFDRSGSSARAPARRQGRIEVPSPNG